METNGDKRGQEQEDQIWAREEGKTRDMGNTGLTASFTVGLLAENTEQNLIMDINNNSTHSRRY